MYVDSHLLGRYVEAGAAMLNANKKREAPSEKTIKNLISCCKAIRTAVGAGNRPSTESLFQRMRKTPKRRYRKAFYRADWTEVLTHNVSAYRLMKEAGLAQGTAYRLANNRANGLNLETLDAVIEALRRLTGKRVLLADLLEYEEDKTEG